jgi:FecR protein
MRTFKDLNVILAAVALALLAVPAGAGTPARKPAAPPKAKAKAKAKTKVRAGKVVAVRGGVTAARGKLSRRLKMKGTIYRGDTISTGKRGRIQVMFTDKTLMNLGPKTTLVVEKYLFGKGKKPEIQTRLKEGVLRVMGGKISRIAPKRFKVKTPTATIGIRGCLWVARVKDGELLVVQMGGKGIDVYTTAGSVPLTKPQQGTYVKGGDLPPERPRLVPLAVLRELINATLVAGTDQPGVLPPPLRPPPFLRLDSGEEGDDGEEDDSLWNPYDDSLDLIEDVITSGTQATNLTFLTELPFDGYMVLGMAGPNGASLADDEVYRGLARAMNDDGDLHGTAIGGLFGFSTRVPKLQPVGRFTHFETKDTYVTWTLKGSPRKLPMTYAHDNLGQFMMFWTDGSKGATFDDGGVHEVNSLGYVGVPGYGLPSDGVVAYGSISNGGLYMTQIRDLTAGGTLEHKAENINAFINYHNDQFVGVLWDTGGGEKREFIIVRGDVDGNKLTNLDFFGISKRFQASTKTDIYEGSGLHGRIFGGQAQAIGFAGMGDAFYTENSGAKLGEWRTAAAAFMNPEKSTSTAAKGVLKMYGFMTGVSEDYQPSTPLNLSESYNLDPTQFRLTVDLDKGDFAGNATLLDGQHDFTGLELGGVHGSTVVSQDVIAGRIGGGSVAGGTMAVRGHAFVSDFHNTANAPWASWGIWVTTYNQGGGNWQVVEGMWVAGVRTPAAEVQALIDGNFSATYKGPARIVRIPSGTSGAERFAGNVSLDIAFGGGGSVTGSINAGPVNMTVGGASAVNSGGFSAAITQVNGTAPSASNLRGIFCGANAKGVVGMARANVGGGSPARYHATFVGKR